MATKAPAPAKEIGYASSQTSYNWVVEGETTPELQWPQSVEVYDAMRRTDSQCASVLRAVTLPVRRTPWRIDPAGARAEVVELVADDMGLPIVGQNPKVLPRTKDRFSWADHLRLALLMLPFGFSFFEQTYRIEPDGSRAHLHKLGQRPARTIMSVDVARDGGLISITQYGTLNNDGPQKPIPVDRLVAYVCDREGGNWLGQSLLRPAYKSWLIKDRLLRVQAQTIERNGMGVPLYIGAETETELDTGRAMAQAWRSGEAAGAAIPNGADLKLRGVEGELPDALPAIEYHDSQIARAVLAHFLNLGTQTGSWALGTTFADFFTLSLQTLAQQIADVATQHIIEDLVDINFGPDEPAPRLTFDEIGSRQAATAQALKSLVDSGVIHPDEVLEESSRQQYGLPPADPATATVPSVDVSHDGLPAGATPTPASDPSVRPGSVAAAGDVGPKGSAATAAPDPDDDDDDFTEVEALEALLVALAEYSGEVAASEFNEALHPRNPRGSPGGGRFRSLADRIIDAITHHHEHGGKDHADPFEGFDREQLRKAAKARGIDLKRGESRESIAAKLLADVGPKKSVPDKPKVPDKPDVPEKPKAAPRKRAPRKAATPKAAPKAPAKSAAIPDLSLPDDISPDDAARYVDLHVQLAAVPWQRKPGTKHEMHRPGAAPLEREMALILQGKSLRTKGMLRREGDTEIKFREWAQANHPYMPLDDVRELVRAGLADAFADRPIAVRTTPAGLSGVLKAGRFKTQFETGRASKGATYYPEKRAQVENELFGYAWDLKPSERPVYGYVAVRDPRHAGYWSQPGRYDERQTEDLLSAYGDVQVMLKPQVRERTTVGIGDTIDSSVLPSAVDAPRWQSSSGTLSDYRSDKFAQRSYAEAQIHGGVGVGDIAEVIFASEPSEMMRGLLKQMEIPWRVL
jgi:hypothetical protein